MHFYKAHGTQNDFVVLPDLDGHHRLTEERVRLLCDRRRGVGADGVIRLTLTRHLLEQGCLTDCPPGVSADMWFMDYYNADGSVAEMCGNGARVTAHVLRLCGVTTDTVSFGTRAGYREAQIFSLSSTTADSEIDMGKVSCDGISTVSCGGVRYAGLALSVGNPHIACVVPSLTPRTLGDVNLAVPPRIDESFFPEGANVEVVTPYDEGEISLRVYERGVGETLSCGTGTVAAAYAALATCGKENGSVTAHVPGGELRVRFSDDCAFLRGASEITAEGDIFL